MGYMHKTLYTEVLLWLFDSETFCMSVCLTLCLPEGIYGYPELNIWHMFFSNEWVPVASGKTVPIYLFPIKKIEFKAKTNIGKLSPTIMS